MKKVNILGSCYSRELFNYASNYKVNCYVLQQSLFTMFSKPLEIMYEEAKGTDNSEFNKRMMYYEFNKLGLEKIITTASDFLIIDFADCRYDIYEFDNPKGVKIIYTHESRATFANIENIPRFKDIEKHYINIPESYTDDEVKVIVKKLIKKLLEVYKPEQIVLNRIIMSDEYYELNEKHHLENNFHLSRQDFINKIEEIFIDELPECKILLPKEEPILNINHRFGGPHPMHFEDIYYEYKMNLLDGLLLGKNNESEVDEKYKKIYKAKIESIKNKKHKVESDCKSAERID